MGSKMDGLYVVKGDKHTYTSKGFNQDNYTIIGVAPFPKTGTSIFLNWKENPLGITETGSALTITNTPITTSGDINIAEKLIWLNLKTSITHLKRNCLSEVLMWL